MQRQGFFGSLFDIDFKSFVTTKIVKVLFVIAIVLSALYTLLLVAAAADQDSGAGVLFLILSPAIFLLFVLYARVLLEFVIVVFRIYENTSVMAARDGGSLPPAGPEAPPAPPPA